MLDLTKVDALALALAPVLAVAHCQPVLRTQIQHTGQAVAEPAKGTVRPVAPVEVGITGVKRAQGRVLGPVQLATNVQQ